MKSCLTARGRQEADIALRRSYRHVDVIDKDRSIGVLTSK
jgi:hypothetical protein